MKPITVEAVARNIVGWVYDFKQDHGRFPSSFADLADNKAPKHSYNPQKALQLHQKLGFATDYTLLSDTSYTLTIRSDKESVTFSSDSGAYIREAVKQ